RENGQMDPGQDAKRVGHFPFPAGYLGSGPREAKGGQYRLCHPDVSPRRGQDYPTRGGCTGLLWNEPLVRPTRFPYHTRLRRGFPSAHGRAARAGASGGYFRFGTGFERPREAKDSMNDRRLAILQVVTRDTFGGGSSKVAWELFQAYRFRGYES